MAKKITRADRIRLAVALTALRFRPGSQSIAAYVIGLRTAFPVASEHASRDRVWKLRLSELEKKISQLEAELDTERIRSLALGGDRGDRNSASTETSGSSACLTEGHPTSVALSTTNGKDKKSRKKKMVITDQGDSKLEKCYCLDLKALQNKAPSVLSTVFATIDTFSRLVLLDIRPGLGKDTVISTTLRSVEVVADSLHSLLMSKNPRLVHKRHLETLNPLLNYVLAHGIPLIYPTITMGHTRKRKRNAGDEPYQGEPIHRLLEILQGRIFIPAIAAIFHLSYSYLFDLLCPKIGTDLDASNIETPQRFGLRQDAPVDIRRCILLFLQDNIHLLFSTISSVNTGDKSCQRTLLFNFQTSLILATIQELDTAVFNRLSEPIRAQSSSFQPGFEITRSTIDYTNDADVGMKHGPSDRGNFVGISDRVKHLAAKDTVWYLCNILHILLDLANEDVGLAQNDSLNHCGGHEACANIQGINSQRASRILAKATDDALFSFMTKCHQTMRYVGERRLPPPYPSGSDDEVHSPSHGGPSVMEAKAGQTLIQTGSAATLHENGLAQKDNQGDRAREQGAIDSVTYGILLAAVERFCLRTFPRGQLVG